MGCELQYSTVTAMEYKKKEDPVYKLKGVMDALMRGADQASPKETFDAIIRAIPTSQDIQELKDAISFIGDKQYLEHGKCENYSDILLYLLNK